MFTRFKQAAMSERLILICRVRAVHHAFCSAENGMPIWIVLRTIDLGTARGDARGIPIVLAEGGFLARIRITNIDVSKIYFVIDETSEYLLYN